MSATNPFKPEPRWGEWLFAGVAAAAAIGALLWGLSHVGARGDLSAVFERPSSSPAAPVPAGVAKAPPIAATARVPSGGKVVYACTVNGKRVYSDVACGADAQVREIDTSTLNTYAPPAIDTTPVAVTPSVVESPTVFVPIERAKAGRGAGDAACRAIEREIDAIDARMRSGYLPQEGEWLRSRRHDAKQRFHANGCTWHTPP